MTLATIMFVLGIIIILSKCPPHLCVPKLSVPTHPVLTREGLLGNLPCLFLPHLLARSLPSLF